MKTVFVGGGQGCRAVLEMVVQQRLPSFSPEVLGVADPNPEAPGMVFAREQGWPTFSRIDEALGREDLELVVEVTGIDEVREQIARLVPERVRIMDHQMARVFWDLDDMAESLRAELTKKIELEEEILEDRQRLQELLDSLPDSVMVLDQNGGIERVNRRFEEVTGLAGKDVEGVRCTDLCGAGPECDKNGEICARARVVETGGPVTVVQHRSCIRRTCEEGDCYYQTVANPIRNAAGEISIVVTSREVTEQVKLARETEELARRARQILDTVHGIITITDLEGRLQFINPAAERFFGFEAAVAEGRPLGELFPAEVAQLIEENDKEVILEGGHLSHEENLVLAGTEHVLITERVMLYDYKDDPVAVCRVSRNITNSRRLQQELLESEKHAAVGKLAAGVAHELNNPLTGILTFSEELLEDISDDTPAHDDIQVIRRETLRCRQIVRDLLDYSRQGVTNRKVIEVESIVSKAVKLVQKQAAFHDVSFKIAQGAEQLLIYADPNQLQQVILNLIINARDAMDGKGELKIASKEDPDDRKVIVEVTDDGCGISPEMMARIFEPFFSTKGDRGNGLGLAAVRSIVEEHGGAITVESVINRGTTFRIALPVSTRAEKEGGGRSRSILPSYHDWSDN